MSEPEFASRPEVTVTTMGKVHNPSGQGVRAVSNEVKKKKEKLNNGATSNGIHHATPASAIPETVVKEGTSKRNIHRKKTEGSYDSRNKKQGGHGKGEWKEHIDAATDLLEYTRPELDRKDPLWDEHDENQGGYILSSHDHAVRRVDNKNGVNGGEERPRPRGFDPLKSKAVYGPMLTLSEFKFQITQCVKEYFDSGDTDEVIRTILELSCQEYHQEIIKRAISLAMDKGPREREMTSRLLTTLHPTPMSDSDMEAGFDHLLESLDDLRTDVPDANIMVASFLARAVVDEVLPPAFLSEQNNNRPGDPVVEKAVTLLSREHCTARLERVWGPGDGRPVAELKGEMDQLLKEYVMSRELDEAARCIKELKTPHFHHELVKRGVTIAVESDGGAKHGGSNIDAMAALFNFLVSNAIISEYQLRKGISRVHQRLPDITLDVPAAPSLLQEFETLLLQEGLVLHSESAASTAAAAAAPPPTDDEAPKPITKET